MKRLCCILLVAALLVGLLPALEAKAAIPSYSVDVGGTELYISTPYDTTTYTFKKFPADDSVLFVSVYAFRETFIRLNVFECERTYWENNVSKDVYYDDSGAVSSLSMTFPYYVTRSYFDSYAESESSSSGWTTSSSSINHTVSVKFHDEKQYDYSYIAYCSEDIYDGDTLIYDSPANNEVEPTYVYDSENLEDIENLTIKLVGVDELIDAITYNNYYARDSDNPVDLNSNVWGLGNFITWEYRGITGEATGLEGLLVSSKNHRCVKLDVEAKLKIDSNTTKTLKYTISDYDDFMGVGLGNRKVSFHDLGVFLKEAYPEYVTDFPTQLEQLTYYLTPFYYDADAAEYHYGNTSRITQNVSSALADYSGDEWDDDNDSYLVEDDDPLSTGNVLNFFNNIGESIKTVINWFKDVINDAFRLISYVGQVPALLSSFFPFIPEELWSLIGIGLFLYFAPALLAGIRNLLKLGG